MQSKEQLEEGYRQKTVIDCFNEFGILNALVKKNGAIVGLNPTEAALISQNKYRTIELFERSDLVNVPATVRVSVSDDVGMKSMSINESINLLEQFGVVISKPNNASLSKGFDIHFERDDLVNSILETMKLFGNDVLIQEYIEGKVYRVVVVFGEVVAVVSNDEYFRVMDENEYNSDMLRIAKHVAAVSELNFCGVDLVDSREGFYLLETNDMPNLEYLNKTKVGLEREIYRKIVKGILDRHLLTT